MALKNEKANVLAKYQFLTTLTSFLFDVTMLNAVYTGTQYGLLSLLFGVYFV